MPKRADSPATTSEAYDCMLPMWQKIDTLLAGTEAMRSAGQTYLPRHEKESHNAYNERLLRTTLLNMTQITLDAMVGKPFAKPVRIEDDVPEEIKALLDDIDMQGNDVNVFARNWFKNGMAKGFSHVLVDFPRPEPRPDGMPRTLADDRQQALRPYLVHIAPENLIFAYSEVVNGVEKLLHVRIKEEVTYLDGFGEKVVCRIKVIEPGLVRIYEERKDPKTKKVVWVEVDSYAFALDFVPLVTFYADRQGFMLSKPPLSDLADLNINHWQSRSDQIAVLTVARFPILAASGAMSEESLTVGPNLWLQTTDTAGRFYYVEHSGAAIEAGRTDLLDLEQSMSEYGATFLKRRPGGASATARALDSAETTSPLQDMVIRFQDAFEAAMQYVADWMKLPTGGSYSINTDLNITDEGGTKLVALAEARLNRDLSQNQYLRELKRFRVLDVDFDPEKNAAELKAEPPPVLPAPPPPNPKLKGAFQSLAA